MYSTCLFCNAPFEKNESLEAFPVGRRLAFDEAKGRLWVVCRKCERWSLSPLDERWEAIEQAERLFRDTRKRVSTDNIGLAKVAEGTTLIRIGAPQRPEFAAWRYGDQFGRRRTRQTLLAGAGMTAIGAVVAGGAAAGLGITGFGWMALHFGEVALHGRPDTIVARLRDSKGRLIRVRRRNLGQTVLSRTEDGSMQIQLRCVSHERDERLTTEDSIRRFEGDEAQRIAAMLIPSVNRFGGSKRQVSEAVSEIESAGGVEEFVDDLIKKARDYTRVPTKWKTFWRGEHDFTQHGLFAMPEPKRLALEMALHEDAERRALQGELATLEKAWRDAEEIAAIADNLTVPDSVSTALDEMKKR